MSRSVQRALGALTAAAVGTIAMIGIAGPAAAHVTVDPSEAEQGGYARLAFRVPNESETASTVKVEVKFPTDTPVSSIRTKPMPGWTAKIVKTTLPKPVNVGEIDVTEAVTSVSWTAQPGTKIKPGEFEEFDVSGGPMPATATSIAFPAIQTYDDGKVVAWNQPMKEGEEPEHPAPTLTLVKGSGGHHGANQNQSTTTGQQKEQQSQAKTAAPPNAHADAATVDSTARMLSGVATGLAAAALVAGLLIAVSVRKKGSSR